MNCIEGSCRRSHSPTEDRIAQPVKVMDESFTLISAICLVALHLILGTSICLLNVCSLGESLDCRCICGGLRACDVVGCIVFRLFCNLKRRWRYLLCTCGCWSNFGEVGSSTKSRKSLASIISSSSASDAFETNVAAQGFSRVRGGK